MRLMVDRRLCSCVPPVAWLLRLGRPGVGKVPRSTSLLSFAGITSLKAAKESYPEKILSLFTMWRVIYNANTFLKIIINLDDDGEPSRHRSLLVHGPVSIRYGPHANGYTSRGAIYLSSFFMLLHSGLHCIHIGCTGTGTAELALPRKLLQVREIYRGL